MGNPQYIQDAVDNFEVLYGGELTAKQRQNLVEALEYGGISLGMDVDYATEALSVWGDYTGDMERALDSVGDLKALLDGYLGGLRLPGRLLSELVRRVHRSFKQRFSFIRR